MASGSRVVIDLVIVAAFEGLVAKEVNDLVFDAALLGLVLEMLKAIGLVPAGGKDVKGNLATDGEAAPVSAL